MAHSIKNYVGCFRKGSSLEQIAVIQFTINLCQEDSFKEVALGLEKPTYGTYIYKNPFTYYVSDPDILSMNAKKVDFAENKQCCYLTCIELEQWQAAVDKQCYRLAERLPYLVKEKVQTWIKLIALEYVTYSQKLELLFDIPRYFMMDFLTREDWMETGDLDEKKLSMRLLEDDRLTDWQRSKIASVCYEDVDKTITQENVCDYLWRLRCGLGFPVDVIHSCLCMFPKEARLTFIKDFILTCCSRRTQMEQAFLNFLPDNVLYKEKQLTFFREAFHGKHCVKNVKSIWDQTC